jgi:uncharacterized protein
MIYFFIFFLNSCTSLFYYPDNKIYGNIESVPYSKKNIKIKSKNGKLLNAYWFFSNKKPQGTVVHFHGNAQNLSAHLFFSHWIPDYDYDLLVFDYQGYGESEGEVSRQNTVEDGISAIEHAVENSRVKNNLFLFGQSLGGAVLLSSFVEFKQHNKICGIVLESTFSSYQAVVRTKLKNFWPTWIFQYPISWMFSEKKSPHKYLPEISNPALVIHGTSDMVVPFENGEKLFELYGIAEKNTIKEFVPLENSGHTAAFGFEEQNKRLKFIEFLQKNACKK